MTSRLAIGIIGGGLSCRLLLHELQNISSTIEIDFTVFEPEPSIGPGLPYGSRCHPGFLLNSPIGRTNFGPPEISLQKWIEDIYPQNDLLLSGTQEMALGHRYLARRDFGKYIQWRFPFDKLSVNHKQDKVIGLRRGVRKPLSVSLLNKNSFEFDRVILATGNPPPNMNNMPTHHPAYFNELYSRLPELIGILEKYDAGNFTSDYTIAVLGTSSAFLDIMRLLQTLKLSKIPKLIAISSSGEIPFPGFTRPDHETTEFPAEYLNFDSNEVSLDNLLEKVELERRKIINNGLSILELRSYLNSKLPDYLDTLLPNEKEYFVEKISRTLESLTKRGCPDVIEYAQQLIEHGQLNVKAARIEGVEEDRTGLNVFFKDSSKDIQVIHANAVINCLGPGSLTQSKSQLHEDLVATHGAKISLSKIGYVTDDNFCVAPNIFAFGPAITGSINRHGVHHHLENAARIFNLSQIAAKSILEEVLNSS